MIYDFLSLVLLKRLLFFAWKNRTPFTSLDSPDRNLFNILISQVPHFYLCERGHFIKTIFFIVEICTPSFISISWLEFCNVIRLYSFVFLSAVAYLAFEVAKSRFKDPRRSYSIAVNGDLRPVIRERRVLTRCGVRSRSFQYGHPRNRWRNTRFRIHRAQRLLRASPVTFNPFITLPRTKRNSRIIRSIDSIAVKSLPHVLMNFYIIGHRLIGLKQ